MTPQVPNSCSLCALKKRKCDRAYPICSRCSQSKREKECVHWCLRKMQSQKARLRQRTSCMFSL
ncbi:hypothetical protein BJX68DRAFT_249285 [Aspergillus pseudodeflectus]|uniref:Zn(2)-C6 fungal-type domain-containing protein n=1 Tax=Aspergillus pseudodeflectus TaxID=176178 RepID=A0ABR4JFY9_9EURO